MGWKINNWMGLELGLYQMKMDLEIIGARMTITEQLWD